MQTIRRQILRTSLCESLRITLSRSYKLFPRDLASQKAVLEEEILDYLNNRRVNCGCLGSVCRLLTSEEIASEGNGIYSEKQILALSRRSKFPLPHFKIGSTVRFPKGALRWWLKRKNLPVRQRGIFNYEFT